MLEWTAQPNFGPELVDLLAPVPVRITHESTWMPRGYESPAEARLETFGPTVMPDVNWRALRQWWLAHERGANTPNWDLAACCDIEGKRGLILVEAKANVPELSPLGKPSTSAPSAASQENHERIGTAIAEACDALGRLGVATKISRDTHYQLSNRLAFTWKLASLGVPTVLVYLGFVGDSGIADAGEPFANEEHWKKAFADYASTVVPANVFETRLECEAAPMWCLLRSRAVVSMSPARPAQEGAV